MVRDNIVIENAELRFRNFSGKEGKFNPEGRRNFCVMLDSDIAGKLEEDGWRVRWLEPRDPDDDRRAYMQVAVRYENVPPKVVLVTSHGKNILNEETIGSLDWAEIENVDLVIRPYNWEMNGKKGVKAYLKNMYVTIVEDPFESKYYDAPDSAQSTVGGCGNCDACDGSCKEHGC